MKNNSKNIFNLFLTILIALVSLSVLSGGAAAQTGAAEIDGTVYPSLQAALDAAEAGQTVKVLKNIVNMGYTGTVIEVPANNKPITLDLNGKVISDNPFRIPTGAHLTLIDSVGGGKITGIPSIGGDPIGQGLIDVSGGTFIMKSGRISEYNFYGVVVSGDGRFEMSGGLLKFTGGHFNINCAGDGFKHHSGGVNLYQEGEGAPTFIMSGGVIESEYGSCWSQCVHLQAGSFIMSGGELNAMGTDAYVVNSSAGTSFEMSGGKIHGSSRLGIYGQAVASITGGEISGNGVGIQNQQTSFSGGSITNNGTGVSLNDYYDIFNFSGGSIEGNRVAGIDYQQGALNLSDAPAEGYGSPVVTGNGPASAPRNLVLKGNKIRIAGPLSASTKVGVYSPTTLGFTKGLGNNGKNYNFSSDNSAFGVDITWDKEGILVEGAAAITSHGTTAYYYSSLQNALDAAEAGQTVRILKTIDRNTDSFPVFVPTGIPVTLDLNSQTIDSGRASSLIIPTDAELTLTDSGSGGKVCGEAEITVVVNGNFTMNSGTIISNNGKVVVMIYNQSSFTLNGGEILGKESGGDFYGEGVKAEGGSFEMNGGKISTCMYGVRKEIDRCDFNIRGGEITGCTTGIFVEAGETVSMNGGSVSGNEYGAVVGGIFNLSGGSITNNTTGIEYQNGASFNLADAPAQGSGSPQVTGNRTNVNTNNNRINITGAMTGAAKLGITMNDPGVFTSGLKDLGTAANFESDDPAYKVGITAEKEAILGRPLTVYFDHNGGTGSMDPLPFIAGESKALTPHEFKRQGYGFEGWNTAADGNGTDYDDGESITIMEDTTLYARWKVDVHTVTFIANGGDGHMHAEDFPFGTTLSLTPNAFIREGHSFTGWNTEADGSGTAYADRQSVTISDDLTLFAQWQRDTYTLSFDPNGGTGTMTDQTFTYGIPQTLTHHAFTRDGHGFEGWNTAADGSGTDYDDGESITIKEDTTLYARWKVDVHTVTFIANGGDGHMHAEDFPFGTTLSLTPNAFVREGHSFTGWNTEADGSGTAYADGSEITISEDLILYAQWSKSLEDGTISLILDPEQFEYDGSVKTVRYRVFDAETGEYLTEGIDYELDEARSTISAAAPGVYTVIVTADNKAAGTQTTAAKTVTGSRYHGTRSGTWRIVRSGIQLFPLFPDEYPLPGTGFSSRKPVELPARPQGLNFSGTGLSLLIPRFDVSTELVRLPLTEAGWPAEWLGSQAGVLEGSALPGEGYSVVAAHNTLNHTEAGPFALLALLEANDVIFVQTADGSMQSFRVYASELIAPDDFGTLKMIGEREAGSLILLTCEDESTAGSYLHRRAVFAKPVPGE